MCTSAMRAKETGYLGSEWLRSGLMQLTFASAPIFPRREQTSAAAAAAIAVVGNARQCSSVGSGEGSSGRERWVANGVVQVALGAWRLKVEGRRDHALDLERLVEGGADGRGGVGRMRVGSIRCAHVPWPVFASCLACLVALGPFPFSLFFRVLLRVKRFKIDQARPG